MGAQIITTCTVGWMVSMSSSFRLTTDSTQPTLERIKFTKPVTTKSGLYQMDTTQNDNRSSFETDQHITMLQEKWNLYSIINKDLAKGNIKKG